MNIKLQNLFNSLAYEKEFSPALHIEYEDIDDIATELLTGILERDIFVEAQRSDYYDWNLETVESISENEMEKLFDILQANEDDRNNQYNEDFPTKWICQRISCKLLGKVAPFPVATSFADEDGIWLVGERINADILQTDKN